MPRPRSDIDTRILHAARARFLEEGVDGASLRKIAKDAGTSIGMVYYYFPTKDDLFFAVVEEVYERLLADIVRILRAEEPFERRLLHLAERAGDASELELMVVRLVLRESLTSNKRFERIVERFQRGHLPLVLGFLGEGVESGALAPDRHPGLLMMSTAALVIVPQMLRRALDGQPQFDGAPAGHELAALLVDVLLGGIGKRTTDSSGAGRRSSNDRERIAP